MITSNWSDQSQNSIYSRFIYMTIDLQIISYLGVVDDLGNINILIVLATLIARPHGTRSTPSGPTVSWPPSPSEQCRRDLLLGKPCAKDCTNSGTSTEEFKLLPYSTVYVLRLTAHLTNNMDKGC